MKRQKVLTRSGLVVLAIILSLGAAPFAWAAPTDNSGSTQPAEQTSLAVSTALATAPVPAESPREFTGPYAPDQIIVVYNSDAAADLGIQTLESTLAAGEDLDQSVLVDQIDDSPIAVVEVPDGLTVQDAVALAEADPAVAFAQPNYIYHLTDATDATPVINQSDQLVPAEDSDLTVQALQPNDPYALISTPSEDDPNQWYLYDANVFGALGSVNTAHSVTVAIIDTGCRLTHNDLAANVNAVDAWDAVNNQALSLSVSQGKIGNGGDVAGHGTHVAGIIGGVLNNGYGIAGVAGNNASLLPIMVFDPPDDPDDEPGASTASIIAGYNYLMTKAVALNIKVVNMSLGEYGDDDQAFRTVIQQAQNNYGIVSVAAAGNGDTSDHSYPSDFPETVSVAAIGSTNAREPYSDFNASKDISAPGGNVFSTYYDADNAYAILSGTSMAAPVVAATLAVMFTENPSLSVADAKSVLYNTAYDLGAPGWDEYYGWGKVNAALAVADVDWNKHPNGLSLDGLSRYGTMSAASQMYFSASKAQGVTTLDKVIVSSGENFPDALAASGLSGVIGAPVLTTTGDTLSVEALNRLTEFKPTTVIVTGSPSSISSTVTTQIKSTLGNSVHIARLEGSNRVQTAEAIYSYGSTAGGWGQTAILAYADNYPDALSIAPYAYANKAPIFLTATNDLSAATETVLLSGSFTNIIIVGGDASISNQLEANLKAKATPKSITINRWAGANRYQTSVVIAQNILAAQPASTPIKIGFTTGEKFPDGLTASPLLGLNNQILLLVTDSESGRYAIDALIHPKSTSVTDILFFGSTDSVSTSLRSDIAKTIGLTYMG